ncbi:MAG: cytochrome c biogenesis protein CcsA [Solirubrobacterales bacterium]
MYGKGLRTLALAAAVTLTAGFALAFFYAPLDADQGFIQKIFYLHVPIAITALGGFIWGGILAIRHLRTGDSTYDLRSYVYIHHSVILGVAVLITGSIWAKASWGSWFVWEEPTLVSFLIVFLLYATYYPLRYSIPDRERQARYASVFAVTAGAFVPLNFMAVRLAESLVHPRVFTSAGATLPGSMALTFAVCLAGIVLMFVALARFEMSAKMASGQIRRLQRTLAERLDIDQATGGPASRIAPVPPGRGA